METRLREVHAPRNAIEEQLASLLGLKQVGIYDNFLSWAVILSSLPNLQNTSLQGLQVVVVEREESAKFDLAIFLEEKG